MSRRGLLLILLASSCGGAPPSTPSATTPTAMEGVAVCRRERPAGCEGAAPSYAGDVAPILSKRCFACHAGNGMAAEDHDFSKWPTLYAQRQTIAAQVTACAMPPRRAPPLEPDEAATLLRWITCGAPQE